MPYFIMAAIEGMPLSYIELALCQHFLCSAIGSWQKNPSIIEKDWCFLCCNIWHAVYLLCVSNWMKFFNLFVSFILTLL